jgi:hypothetical protein
MITSIAIGAALFLALMGLIALSRAVKHAPGGFEDEFGFHRGIAPHNESDAGVNCPKSPAGPIKAA